VFQPTALSPGDVSALKTVVINSGSSTSFTLDEISFTRGESVSGISLKIPLHFTNIQTLVLHHQMRQFLCHTSELSLAEALLMLEQSPS
jgi:hypothetical protein